MSAESDSTPPVVTPASPREGVNAMLRHAVPVGTERVDACNAAGRVLAETVRSDRSSPAGDVSAMDGFAVCTSDVEMAPLPISGESRAGRRPDPLVPRSAQRISTGAVLPPGADAVIRAEDSIVRDGHVGFAVNGVRRGQHVRRSGENAAAGVDFGQPGSIITPALAGAIAAFGLRSVTVFRRVRIALVVTGDELVPVDAMPEAWQIRDSNGPSLRTMLAWSPWIESSGVLNAPDDPRQLRRALSVAAESADLVLLSGGVSVGVHDHVPGALASLGARTVFRGLPQRPGRPVLGAIIPSGPMVLGLPGNPVSVLVTARRMARPVAAALAGLHGPEHPPVVRARGHDRVLDLWWHRPARRTAPGEVEIVDTRGSGDLVSAALSEGFVEIPPSGAGEGPWPFYGWEW